MLFAQKWPKWQFLKGWEIIHIFSKGVKMTQNRSKPWAIAYAFCSKMAKNDSFWKGEKWFIFFLKVWKWPKIDQNHGLSPMLFAQKWPKMTVFERVRNYSYFSKRCENDPKSIKTMGYSPCFFLKNANISSIFLPWKIIHICQKGVKMTQNRSKPWAIAHAFSSKMPTFHRSFFLEK